MARKSLLLSLVDLPSFLLGVFFLYWSVPLSVLLGKVQFWKLVGKRDDAYGWAKGLQQLFGIKVLQLPGPTLCKADKIVYLANHRSWADFFLDVVMTDGRAQMLSRMAVFAVFPAFMLPVTVIRSVILFQRGKKVDIEAFNSRITKMMEESPVEGLIVYPEGHRSTKQDSLALKRGMLHYCFDHKCTVQIIITKNKEAVLSEKDMSCHLGQSVLVGYADAIHPKDYSSFQDFFDQVQKTWSAEWARVYSADWQEGQAKESARYDTHSYPISMKLLQVLATGSSCVAFFVALYWSARALLALLWLAGPLQVWVMSVLAVWVGVSLARACVDMRQAGGVAKASNKQL